MIDQFHARLARGPILLDAAMGTRLLAQGLDLATDDPCRWTLTRPDLVVEVHRRDVDAGSEALFTNTFGANRGWLKRWDGGQDVATINRKAVILARAAAGSERLVIGSIGPTATERAAWLREQAAALIDAEVDALVLETMTLDQALVALEILGQVGIPILVGLLAWPDPVAATIRRLADAGAAVVGANCFVDLALADRLLDAIEVIGDQPCWLKPAAGLPGGPSLTLGDFTTLAWRVARLPTPGLLGGCCGTTAAHLAAIRQAWESG